MSCIQSSHQDMGNRLHPRQQGRHSSHQNLVLASDILGGFVTSRNKRAFLGCRLPNSLKTFGIGLKKSLFSSIIVRRTTSLSCLNAGVHSLRRNLLSLPKGLPLCAAFYLLSRQNPVLDLNCIRQMLVKTNIHSPEPWDGFLSCWYMNCAPGGHRGTETRKWQQGILGDTEGRHRNKPNFICYVPRDHPEVPTGTGWMSCQHTSGSRKSWVGQLPCFLPRAPSSLEAAASAQFFGIIKII